MGLWDEAQNESASLRFQQEQYRVRQAQQSEERKSAWDHRQREMLERQHRDVAEFLDGMRKLGVAPQPLAVYEWFTDGYDAYSQSCYEKRAEILGWDLMTWPEGTGQSYPAFILLSPAGEVFDTTRQPATKKGMFGRRFAPKPSPLPFTRLERIADGTPTGKVVEIELSSLLKQRLVKAMTTSS